MIWAVIILSILLVLFLCLYKKALSETNSMRSMYILAVLDSQFCQGQRNKIMDYLKSVTASDAMEVSKQFITSLDGMITRLSKESPLLLGAHAALWDAFKKAKQET